MTELDYDDPQVEERWCAEARRKVVDYLTSQRLDHGEVGEWPAWHVAPLVSVWAVESLVSPGLVGWWAIYGDLPTDYISAAGVRHPREAIAAFAQNWSKYVADRREGRLSEDVVVGDSSGETFHLLSLRAGILADLASDDDNWDEDEDEG